MSILLIEKHIYANDVQEKICFMASIARINISLIKNIQILIKQSIA